MTSAHRDGFESSEISTTSGVGMLVPRNINSIFDLIEEPLITTLSMRVASLSIECLLLHFSVHDSLVALL